MAAIRRFDPEPLRGDPEAKSDQIGGPLAAVEHGIGDELADEQREPPAERRAEASVEPLDRVPCSWHRLGLGEKTLIDSLRGVRGVEVAWHDGRPRGLGAMR